MATAKSIQGKIARREAKLTELTTERDTTQNAINEIKNTPRLTMTVYQHHMTIHGKCYPLNKKLTSLDEKIENLTTEIQTLTAELNAFQWRVYHISDTKACYVVNIGLKGDVTLLERYATQQEALDSAKRYNLKARRWHGEDNETFLDAFLNRPTITEE